MKVSPSNPRCWIGLVTPSDSNSKESVAQLTKENWKFLSAGSKIILSAAQLASYPRRI